MIQTVVDRMRMALAEVGYLGARLSHLDPNDPNDIQWLDFPGGPRAEAAFWQAAYVVKDHDVPCWSCWQASGCNPAGAHVSECLDGNCAHPEGPARPPRRLLRAS